MHTNLMSQTVCSRFALRAENERRLIKGVGILIFWSYLILLYVPTLVCQKKGHRLLLSNTMNTAPAINDIKCVNGYDLTI